MRFFYFFIFLFLLINAAKANDMNYITKDEFEILKSDFVSIGCNIEGILSSADRLKVSNTYSSGGRNKPLISSLSKSALCLISRSSDFLVDYEMVVNNVVVKKTIYNTFPKKGNVVGVIFQLPYKISKQCDDDGVVAFFITFTKKDAKLQRDILLTSDILDCNIGSINIPKKYRD